MGMPAKRPRTEAEKEKNRLNTREWYQKNKAYVSKYNKRYREEHPDIMIRIKYGITGEDYACILKEQNGVCAICKGEHTLLCVDHDHITGAVRGLLCHKCNSALGMLGDTLDAVRSAVSYMEHAAKRDFRGCATKNSSYV